MKKVILFLVSLNFLSFSNTINYETLSNEKKYVMDMVNKLKNIQINSINYENSSLIHSDDNTSGENIIYDLEDEILNKRIGVKSYVIANKNKYYFNNSINFGNKFIIEGNTMEIGGNIGYLNGIIDKNKLNGIDFGLDLKAGLADYKLNFSTINKFNYTNIKYEKNFNQNYFSLLGAANIKMRLGEKFFVEPGLRFAYDYNLKSKILDHNNDKIELLPSLNYSIGGFARLGYIFGAENNFKISFAYGIDKKLNNLNNFKIYDKKVLMKADNYILHDIETTFEMKIKEKHNLVLSIGYIDKNAKGGISYKYNW